MNSILKKMIKTKAIKLNKVDYEKVNNDMFVKELRKKLNMTQRTFAGAIGASVKTIEKWESGQGTINNIALRLLYLLDKKPYLINDVYPIESVNISYDYQNESAVESIDGLFKSNRNIKREATLEWKGTNLMNEGGYDNVNFNAW